MYPQPNDFYAKFKGRDDLPMYDMVKQDFPYPSREEVPKLPLAFPQVGQEHWVVDNGFTVTPGPPLHFAEDTGALCLQVTALHRSPLFAVNGKPVVAASCDAYILLPVGRHLVEAQEISTVDPVVVEIKPGAVTTLQYASESTHPIVTFSHASPGIPLLMKPPYIPPKLPLLGAVGAVGVSAAVGLWMATSDLFLGLIAFLAIMAALYAAWKPVEVWARSKAWEELNYLRQLRAEGPQAYPWGSPSTSQKPHLVGNQPVELPPFASGCGALALHAVCYRHRAAPPGLRETLEDSLGRPERFLATLMTKPPRIWVDGEEMPATWGAWWYPLPAGEHTLTVEVDGQAAQTYTDDGSPSPDLTKRREIAFTVTENEAVALSAEAHTYFIKRPSSFDFFQPRLWVEPGHPDHYLNEMKRT